MAEAGIYKGKVEFPPAELSFEKVEGFDLITFQDAGYPTDAGVPSIPSKQINVALPTGAVVKEVRVAGVQALVLEGTFSLLPVAEAIPISAAPAAQPFQPDPAIFTQNENYPGIHVENVHAWDWVGQDFITIELYPVQYNPVTRKVTVMTRIDFEVVYDVQANAKKKAYNFSQRQKKEFKARLKEMAFNTDQIEPLSMYLPSQSKSVLEEGHYEYVIISSPFFKNGFEDLLEWRTRMGMPATLVDTFWIFANYSGNDDVEKIRNFVIDAHETWGATYFLLGGDSNYVPYHYKQYMSGGGKVPNDTYYADYDSDWKYEVYVGRACIITEPGARDYVAKVLAYEQNPPADFGDSVFFMGFDLDGVTKGENCKTKIKNEWLPADMVYEQEYDSESGGHASDVRARMNLGFNLVNHIDHCNTTILGVGTHHHNAVLTTADARNFSNGARLCNFYTLGCYAGNYQGGCWGESLAFDDQGGITFVGNSRNGYYNPGNTNSLSNKYDQKWWQALFEYNAYRAGETLAVSLNNYTPSNNTYRHIFAELNLLGDPALHIWTDDPLPLEVSHKAQIDPRGQLFAVDVSDKFAPVEDALVCLMLEGDVYKTGYTLGNGRAVFWIHPTIYGALSVTVTAQNRRCYQGEVDVTTLFPQAPEVGRAFPCCGIEQGGTEIVIKGRKFSNKHPMIVTIDDKPCTDVVVLGPNRITCVTPANTTGRYDLVISNNMGEDNARDAFFYFPTGGEPFNSTDRDTTNLNVPGQEQNIEPDPVNLIVSGQPLGMYIIFYSAGGGPLPTPFGNAGLDLPVVGIQAATLNAQGFALIPVVPPVGWAGYKDFYIHVLGTSASGQPVWSIAGNNPNGTGSIWFHQE